MYNLASSIKKRTRAEGVGKTGLSGRHLELRGRKWHETGANWAMWCFIVCTPHQIICRLSNQEERDGRACGRHRKEEI